jgi:hypothetical protein
MFQRHWPFERRLGAHILVSCPSGYWNQECIFVTDVGLNQFEPMTSGIHTFVECEFVHSAIDV